MNWKNIRSLFVVEEESNKEKQKDEKETQPKDKKKNPSGGNTIVRKGSVKKPTTPPPPSPPVAPPNAQEVEKVRKKFFESLHKALEDNNLEGVDYLEFRNTLKSFENMPMDEQLRFQSALTAVKTMGATKQVILDSAQHYIQVLENDRKQFTAAVERHKSERVDGQLQRIEQLKAQRAEKEQLIQELKKELDTMSQEINGISSQIHEDKNRIESRYHAYLSIFETVAGQIRKDMEKIKTVEE